MSDNSSSGCSLAAAAQEAPGPASTAEPADAVPEGLNASRIDLSWPTVSGSRPHSPTLAATARLQDVQAPHSQTSEGHADPATPAADAVQALYWQSLQQHPPEQLCWQEDPQSPLGTSSPQTTLLSSPPALPSVLTLPPQHHQQEARLNSTVQEHIDASLGATSCPASPISPTSDELLLQLRELQEQLAALTRQAGLGTSRPPAASAGQSSTAAQHQAPSAASQRFLDSQPSTPGVTSAPVSDSPSTARLLHYRNSNVSATGSDSCWQPAAAPHEQVDHRGSASPAHQAQAEPSYLPPAQQPQSMGPQLASTPGFCSVQGLLGGMPHHDAVAGRGHCSHCAPGMHALPVAANPSCVVHAAPAAGAALGSNMLLSTHQLLSSLQDAAVAGVECKPVISAPTAGATAPQHAQPTSREPRGAESSAVLPAPALRRELTFSPAGASTAAAVGQRRAGTPVPGSIMLAMQAAAREGSAVSNPHLDKTDAGTGASVSATAAPQQGHSTVSEQQQQQPALTSLIAPAGSPAADAPGMVPSHWLAAGMGPQHPLGSQYPQLAAATTATGPGTAATAATAASMGGDRVAFAQWQAAQHQLDHLIRLQQLQLMQMQMQAMAGATTGAGLSAAGQDAALPWGSAHGVSHPAALHAALQQQLQQPMLASGMAAAYAPAAPSMAAAAAGVPADPYGGSPAAATAPPVCQESSSSAQGSALAGCTSPGPAAAAAASPQQLEPAAAPAAFSLGALIRSVPVFMLQASLRHTAAQLQHGRGSRAASEEPQPALAGTGRAAPGAALPAAILQRALYPVTAPLAAAVGGSSLALQVLGAVSGTAAVVATSTSAWSAHFAVMACITLSQYQLLALLCCLTAVAAAAQAASSAAAAAAGAGRLVMRLAGREARLFGRAAAVVAVTDVKQLCKLLATQPLQVLQGQGGTGCLQHPAQTLQLQPSEELLMTEEDATPAGQGAEGGSRSLSRGVSFLLAGVFSSSAGQRGSSEPSGWVSSLLPASRPSISASGSRRSSGPWAVDRTLIEDGQPQAGSAAGRRVSRELSVHVSNPAPMDEAPVGAAVAFGQGGGVAGVPARTLVLCDSLAVVSGLWAGLGVRLSLLLLLQAPLASCRIWLQALNTACYMSVMAAVASMQTALMMAWHMAHLSLAVLGSASAHSAAVASGGVKGSQNAAGARSVVSAAAVMVLAALQWAWLQVRKPLGAASHRCATALAAAVPGGGALVQVLAGFAAAASSALAALASSASSAGVWLKSVQRDGLFSRAAVQALAARVLQLVWWQVSWLAAWVFGLMEAGAVLVTEWLLRDASPVGRAAVYGSARMIKGLVVEAGRQSGLLAAQLFEAWMAHRD